MRLAALDIAPINTDVAVYTVPFNRRAIVTLELCNRGAAAIRIRVALTSGAAPTAADWIDYDAPLPAAGTAGGSTAHRTGIAMAAGDKLWVRSTVATLSAVVHGIQEPI